MRYFEQSGVRGSVLGFGCGSMMGRVGRRDSLAALGAAWDAGINLFDVARSYGYGAAEDLLGEFLCGRRDEAVVVTKFGLWSDRPPRWKTTLKPVVRKAVQLLPRARPVVRHLAGGSRTTAEQFTAPLLRASLTESLRALRTDYVDVLLFHGPPTSVVDDDDLMSELADVVAEGKVRLAGLAGGEGALRRATDGPPVLQVLQAAVNVFDLGGIGIADSTDRLFLANHPFGGAEGIVNGKAMLQQIADDPSTSVELRDKLAGVDQNVLADAVLSVLLRGTAIKSVIPSMMRLDHLSANVAAIERSRFSATDAATLRELFMMRAERIGTASH